MTGPAVREFGHTTIVTCPAYEGLVSCLPYTHWFTSEWEINVSRDGWYVEVPLPVELARVPVGAAVMIQARSPLCTYSGMARVELIDPPVLDQEVIIRFIGEGPLYQAKG
jgi:hypothetical protein